MSDILGIIPLNIFAYSWVAIILAGILVIIFFEYFKIARFHVWIGILTLLIASIPFVYNFYQYIMGWFFGSTLSQTSYYFGFTSTNQTLGPKTALLVMDPLTVFLGLIFIGVNILVLVSTLEFMKKENNMFIFTSLLLLITMGMILVAAAIDIVTLIVSWELVSIPSFILVAFKKQERESTEAAVKFFIIGAVSSAMLLFGASLLYGLTPAGSTNYYVMMAAIMSISSASPYFGTVAILGLAMVVAGLGFKMGTTPFHWWLPDTYEGAVTPITTMLAAASKKVGFAAGFRILLIPELLGLTWTSNELAQIFNVFLVLVAIATMIVGNIGALVQTRMKRLLAYSSIGQAGYIMLAIASFDQSGFVGGLFHVLAHAIMTVGAFVAVMIITSRTGTDDIVDYKGLRLKMPKTAIALSIILMSLAGIPPFIGFFSKLFILFGAIDGAANYPLLTLGAIIMIVTSVISVYYYVRVVVYMSINPLPDDMDSSVFDKAPSVPWTYGLPLGISFVLTAIVLLYLPILYPLLNNIVQAAIPII